METTGTILLVLLGTVSGIVILVFLVIGIKIWKILSAIQRITKLFADESDHMKQLMKKIRSKIHNMME